MRNIVITIGIVFFTAFAVYRMLFWKTDTLSETVFKSIPRVSTATPTVSPTPTALPQVYIIPQEKQVFQSFNNCGPASLAMLLSYHDVDVSQEVLGLDLRPYQNPIGDNDDKSVTLPELAEKAKSYNLIPYYRPNGSIELAKQLLAQDTPFIVRTWLNPNEDIGHYRVVRGYDDTTQEFIQDDSYQGANLRYSYDQFLEMWQPFNYEYLILVEPGEKERVEGILGEDVNWHASWQRALEHAQKEQSEDPQSIYPIFNQSIAYYHLGEYELSVQRYEEVSARLPNRMLWYQIEPIKSYVEIGNYSRVFTLTDSILNNQNRGFSELYILRGKAYEKQGNVESARTEYQQAVFYNTNLLEAQQALQELQNKTTQ